MPERQKQNAVVKSAAFKEKKSIIKRALDIFSVDDIPDFKSYFLKDLLLPIIFNGLDTLITNTSHVIFKKGRRAVNNGSPSISFGRSTLNSVSSMVRTPSTSVTTEYEGYLLDSWDDCAEVLKNMNELIEACGRVSILDYYDFIGKSSNNYQLDNFGWTSEIPNDIRPNGSAWYINLPKAKPLPKSK